MSLSSSSNEDNIIVKISINLPRPRQFRDWLNTLEGYDYFRLQVSLYVRILLLASNQELVNIKLLKRYCLKKIY